MAAVLESPSGGCSTHGSSKEEGDAEEGGEEEGRPQEGFPQEVARGPQGLLREFFGPRPG
jgi:hypothetical protein